MKKTNATQLTVIMLGIQWSIALPAMAINESDISVVTPVQTLSDFSVSETPQTVFTSEPDLSIQSSPSNDRPHIHPQNSSDLFNASTTLDQQDSTLSLEKQEVQTDSAIAQISPASQQLNIPSVSPPAQPLDLPLDSEAESLSESSMEQVTSVSQLSDVQPTDWAFSALQALVERYGCIAGYPDGTFRGNRAMTRYEFAAGLNACLERINELVTGGTANYVTKEDLARLQRLQEEFATELGNLNERLNTLEARTTQLEANQFSTTTKLRGQVLTYLGDAFGENASEANNTALGYRAILSLSSSFTGKDNLLIKLQSINLRRFDTATEFPSGRLSGATDETRFLGSSITGDGSLRLSGLQYKFPVGKKLIISLDAFSSNRILTEPLSPFSNPTSGAISYFGSANPMLYPVFIQSGITAQWKATPWLNLDLSLGSESGSPSNPNIGLFKGGYGAAARSIFELGNFRLSLNYVNSYSLRSGFDTLSGSNAAQVIGAGSVSTNTYLVGVSYDLTPTIEVGGSVAYANVRTLGTGTRGDANVWDYRFNLAFRDLGQKGNLAGLVFGMQPKLTGTSNSSLARAIGLPVGQRSDRDTGFHIEAFYTHRLTNNIAITPGIIWLTAPNHDERNPDVVVGVIRTSFSF
jgi:hypothetical protein